MVDLRDPGHSDTEREILSQPNVWRQTLRGIDVATLTHGWQVGSSEVIVTGCGSTHYLALTVAALLREVAGVPARAAPASELLSGKGIVEPPKTTLLAFSRSGTTTETLLAIEAFRRAGGRNVVAVTCYPDSPMASAADCVLAAPAAQELSVAQTRSFSSMLLLGQALVASTAGLDPGALYELPDYAQRLLETSRPQMKALGVDSTRGLFFFLGSGALFGVASEAMLKLKEMSLTASEAYHVLEFRHGPMSMCDPLTTVLGLIEPDRKRREQAVLQDIGPTGTSIVELGADGDVDIPAEVPTWARPVLYLLPLQLLALERALAKGLDPDSPRHLTAVIHLDDAEPA